MPETSAVKRSAQSTGLGELEAAVMDRLWTSGPADVKAVHRAIGAQRGITPNTVQSTMERLYKKGLLKREKVSHAFVYETALTREQFGSQVIAAVVDQLAHGEAGAMLNALVDVAEREGDEALERLERLVAERRRHPRRGK